MGYVIISIREDLAQRLELKYGLRREQLATLVKGFLEWLYRDKKIEEEFNKKLREQIEQGLIPLADKILLEILTSR